MNQFQLKATAAQVEKLLAELRASKGTTVEQLTDRTYEISGSGIHAVAAFDEAAGRLEVNVLQKPFLVPLATIQGRLQEALQKEGS